MLPSGIRSGYNMDIHTGFFHLDKGHPVAIQALHQAAIAYDGGWAFSPLTIRQVWRLLWPAARKMATGRAEIQEIRYHRGLGLWLAVLHSWELAAPLPSPYVAVVIN